MRFADHRLVEFGRCAGDFACAAARRRKGFMTEPRGRRNPGWASFEHAPFRRRPIGGSPEELESACYSEKTANFLRSRRFLRKTVSKTAANPVACQSTREIPCAAEQGINSTTTGNPAERPDAPDSRQIPSPSRIKDYRPWASPKQQSPTDHKRPRAPLSRWPCFAGIPNRCGFKESMV